MTESLNIILPDWDAPTRIRALTTTRKGGVSKSPYDSFNLAHHVGDESESVRVNRDILSRDWLLPRPPHWLNQTHSIEVIEISDKLMTHDADASWTGHRGMVCTVMTADCLPILLYQENPDKVAAIHAGWRGLQAGIIEQTIEVMNANTSALTAWLGPAIGPTAFEVGAEVREAFLAEDTGCSECFMPSKNSNKYMANLYHLAKRRLHCSGVTAISGGDYCTFMDDELFYSYRRDGQTGRMATLIWIDE